MPVPNGDALRENNSEQSHETENEVGEGQRSPHGKEDMQSESGHRSVQFSPDATQQGFLDRNEHGQEINYADGVAVEQKFLVFPCLNMIKDIADSQLSLLRPGSSEMSIIYNSEGFPVRIIKNNQVLHTTASDIRSIHGMSSPVSEHLRNGFPLERSPQPTTRPPSVKQRARSLPRRIVEKDPFEGLEGGWWSKGEVQRNKEREVDIDDIPAAGYSGHMPGANLLVYFFIFEVYDKLVLENALTLLQEKQNEIMLSDEERSVARD
ncbi:unnamed protein product [Strongylus vulgaris]|uniref:Uncharacterized protein n=1 Tax=Strongylus vulgaris TaxID=40348 RepID=A0A3P7L6Q6_STRVU|nr:unnamed protein product [Strongylus vulgaris]